MCRAKIRFMQAHRALLETDENGCLSAIPPLPPNVKVEAIFLVLDAGRAGKTRTPPELAALRIVGDVVALAFESQEWNLEGGSYSTRTLGCGGYAGTWRKV
jgi:hypothetical protein